MSSHEYGAAVLDNNKNYQPFDKEPFMNGRQRDYFRQKLLIWRDEIVKEAKETLAHLQAEKENHADLADRASLVTDREVELRARDRQRKLLAKIDAALSRLEDGTYGYCAETSEPISLKRLDARPSPRSQSRRRNVTSAASASIARSESFQFVVGFRSARVLCRPLAVSCPPHTSEVCTINTSGFDFR
jgi:DnaK suppressor protein